MSTLDNCITETVTLGEEKIQYFVIGPHRGCCFNCKFCGVKASRTCESKLKSLGFLAENNMTEKYGKMVFAQFEKLADADATDVLFMNGGNIIRESEMFLPTITEWIPKFINESTNFESMTIEVRADDIVEKISTLLTIKKNLGNKKLVVRLPIEYADEKMLASSEKGITLKTIANAIAVMKENEITFDAYTMFGGVSLNLSSATCLAEKTVRFAFDNSARNVIINTQFVTEDMRSIMHNVFVPSLGNIISLLKKLSDIKGKIKVGFDGDEILNPIIVSEGTIAERELLEKFNVTQII